MSRNTCYILFQVILLSEFFASVVRHCQGNQLTLDKDKVDVEWMDKDEAIHSVSKRMMDLTMCIGQFEIHPNTIIRTGESQAIGGKYLQGIELQTAEECQRLCCRTEGCDVYIFETKNNGYCYLFTCGPLDNFHCKFTHHTNYTSAVLNPSFGVSHGSHGSHPQLTSSAGPPLSSYTSIPISQQERELLHLKGVTQIHVDNGIPLSSKLALNSNGIEFSRNFPNKLTLNNDETESTGLQHPLQTARNTSSSKLHCGRFQFSCHSGECIAVYNACDGIPQCEDGSDEGPECSEAENRNFEPEMVTPPPVHQIPSDQRWKDSQTKIYKNYQVNPWETQQYPINSKENQRKYTYPQDSPKKGPEISKDEFANYVHNNWIQSTIPSMSKGQGHFPSLPEEMPASIFQYNSENRNWHKEEKISQHLDNRQNEPEYLPGHKNNPLLKAKGNEVHSQQSNIDQKSHLAKEKSSYLGSRVGEVGQDEYEVYVDETSPGGTTSRKESHKHNNNTTSHNNLLQQSHAYDKDNKNQNAKWHLNDHPSDVQNLNPDVPIVHEQYRMIHDHLALELRDHDGFADRPNGAVISLLLGLSITVILAGMIICRLRSWKHRPIPRMTSSTKCDENDGDDSEIIVNGMYL